MVASARMAASRGILQAEPVTEPTSTRFRAWAAVALVACGAVVVSLTMFKAFFVIGMLWRPEAQRNRSMEWTPFALCRDSTTWFGPRLGDPDKVVEVAAPGPAEPGSPAQAGVASVARP